MCMKTTSDQIKIINLELRIGITGSISRSWTGHLWSFEISFDCSKVRISRFLRPRLQSKPLTYAYDTVIGQNNGPIYFGSFMMNNEITGVVPLVVNFFDHEKLAIYLKLQWVFWSKLQMRKFNVFGRF